MLAAIVLVSGCDKAGLPEAADNPLPLQGLTLKGLVTASAAPTFHPGDAAITEVLYSKKSWEFHDDKGRVTVLSSAETAFEAFKDAREKAALEGVSSRILVSADAGMRFKALQKLARGAFNAGFERLDFLVRGPDFAGEYRALYLEFPIAVGSSVPPDIEPKFVKIDADGAIFANPSASRIPLDGADSDSSLPLLNEDLSSYSAAARAAASTPMVQILVDGDATYQRWIDVMARCHANGLTRVFVADVNLEIETTCQGMTCPVANPGPDHLPVAPSRDRLVKQLVLGAN